MNAPRITTTTARPLTALLLVWLGQLALIEINELGLLHQIMPAPSGHVLAWEACQHTFTLGLCTVFVLTSLMILVVARWNARTETPAETPAS